jgi:hypothetical protein
MVRSLMMRLAAAGFIIAWDAHAQKVKELKWGGFVLIPARDKTHGHGAHTWADVWKPYLQQLLAEQP